MNKFTVKTATALRHLVAIHFSRNGACHRHTLAGCVLLWLSVRIGLIESDSTRGAFARGNAPRSLVELVGSAFVCCWISAPEPRPCTVRSIGRSLALPGAVCATRMRER